MAAIMSPITAAATEIAPPSQAYDGYSMNLATREALEADLVENVRDNGGADPGVYAVWLSHNDRYADILRSHEVGLFPEIPEIVADYENLCEFLALVDTRGKNPGVVHGFRVSGKGPSTDDRLTGLPFIDQIIDSDQGLTAEHFLEHYNALGTDLADHAMSVETNFRIKKTDRVNGIGIPQLGYLSLFNRLDDKLEVNRGVLFAHLNLPAKLSLHGAGVEYTDIAGVKGLRTPTVVDGKITFDKKYNPVDIGATQSNLATFRALSAFAIPPVEVQS